MFFWRGIHKLPHIRGKCVVASNGQYFEEKNTLPLSQNIIGQTTYPEKGWFHMHTPGSFL